MNKIFELSFLAFSIVFKVPIKFVDKTWSGFFFDISTAGSAQQSIMRSYFFNFFKEFFFDTSNL